jgi:hypothetical protein
VRRTAALVVLAALLAACGGGGSTADGGQKRFLLVMHSPLMGSLASKPDAELVDLGTRACASLDAKQPSDAVVTSMSGGAEPGSAAFNTYAYLVASAATELCPAHKSELQQPLPNG